MSKKKHSAGFTLTSELTLRADRSVIELFSGSKLDMLKNWCVIALGGYGRQELCPFSDLDLLFLMEKKTTEHEAEKALQEILYPLWDKGFNASYSVRTIRQVLKDIKSDFFFQTSIIDSRFICGSRKLFKSFAYAIASDTLINNRKKFIAELTHHTRKRHEKYGDTTYFLEPHIKDGHGGLRDYQSIIWTLKVMGGMSKAQQSPVCAADMVELEQAASFMLKTRFKLHELTSRKTDQMHLEHQEKLAREMGYEDAGEVMAVEAFLKDFHTMSITIRSIIDTLLLFLGKPGGIRSLIPKKIREGRFTISSGLLDFTNPEDVAEDPLIIMKVFRILADEGLFLSPIARSIIRDFIRTGDALRENPDACRMLLEIFKLDSAESTLVSMLETGVIEELIPEFTSIRGRTIFDVYHTFTVDLHSIHTLIELKGVMKSELEVFEKIQDKDVLFFSTFLHDIGKGYGRPHASIGAGIIKPIARRFGFNEKQTELISFLVENHLMLADIASKRDLSEEKVISDLAQRIGDCQRLAMLYLLTMADSKATGPNAWNEWKASLLWELYTRTLHILEKGILRNRKDATSLHRKWHELIRISETDEGAFFAGRLWALPQAYLLVSELKDIRRHLDLSSKLSGDDDIKVDIVYRKSYTQLTIITHDRPGLFSLLTGILSIYRIEIISAQIFTWYDGTVVDTFKVLPPWPDFREWGNIESRFREFLTGKDDLKVRIARTKSLKTHAPEPVQAADAFYIAIDNDTSDFFTIIDVRAVRRIGLTHDISTSLSSLGLDIHRAFLSLSSDLVASVFYVVGSGGEKITDETLQQELADKIRTSVLSQRKGASPGDGKGLYNSGRTNTTHGPGE